VNVLMVGVVCNLQIPMIGKHKPVPETTYEYPKDHEILDQVKEENRKASQVWKMWWVISACSLFAWIMFLNRTETSTTTKVEWDF